MPQQIDKELVRKRFLKSIKTYNENAYVQKLMANRLLDRLKTCKPQQNFNSILELGCGTGLLTKKVINTLHPENYYANDIVGEYKDSIKPVISESVKLKRFDFLEGDIEKIDHYPANIDLIISNAAIQWLTNIDKFMINLSKNSSKNTTIAMTTFGPNNLHEIKTIGNSSLSYHPFGELKEIVNKHLNLLYAEEEEITLNFETPFEVLKHLRNTGTTGITKQIWTREHLRKFEEKYLKYFGNEKGVTLTYNPIYLIAERR